MLTSDTMSMLATSILMPTATGAPLNTHRTKLTQETLRGRFRVKHTDLTNKQHTSKVRPETDIIPLQQFVHGLLHVRHVPRLVDAERHKTTSMKTLSGGRTPSPCPSSGPAHLWAQHITATTSGSDRVSTSPAPRGPRIPSACGGRVQQCGADD